MRPSLFFLLPTAYCLLLSAYSLALGALAGKTKTGQPMASPFGGINPGNDRLSHKVPLAVPWALEGLTTVFGMGTGVSPPVWSPENC